MAEEHQGVVGASSQASYPAEQRNQEEVAEGILPQDCKLGYWAVVEACPLAFQEALHP